MCAVTIVVSLLLCVCHDDRCTLLLFACCVCCSPYLSAFDLSFCVCRAARLSLPVADGFRLDNHPWIFRFVVYAVAVVVVLCAVYIAVYIGVRTPISSLRPDGWTARVMITLGVLNSYYHAAMAMSTVLYNHGKNTCLRHLRRRCHRPHRGWAHCHCQTVSVDSAPGWRPTTKVHCDFRPAA